VIAYELLNGVHPYDRCSAPRARERGLRPAPIRSLKRKEARVIERCLSFDRAARPQNAAEFLKAFRGVSTLQKASIAAVFVLAAAALGFWRQSYIESGPSMPFAQLSPTLQQEFRAHMGEGEEAWKFYERDGIGDALEVALSFYAQAWDVHPRNREAAAALDRAAAALLDAAGEDGELRRMYARQLLERSAHFRNDPRVREAAQ
jgi:hypothetical protein